jgi:hypothetical protein
MVDLLGLGGELMIIVSTRFENTMSQFLDAESTQCRIWPNDFQSN